MTNEEINARFGQMLTVQLRFQEQMGDLAGVVRQVVETQQLMQRQQSEMAERQAEMAERQAAMEQRQAEQDERFNILLSEIRFIIRRLAPEEGSPES